MHSIDRRVFLCAFALLFAAGCERVALLPRQDIDVRHDQSAAAPERYARDREPPARAEVVGTVERVDDVRREIYLRTNDRRNVVLKYDPSTVVIDRDREFSVVDLRSGDLVRAEPGRGEYVDVIRILEARRS